MPVPLDQKYILFTNEKTRKEEQLPALHPRWCCARQFVSYQAPPLQHEDQAALGEWRERLGFITTDLHWMLTLTHDKFWCQVIFDETFHACLDSFLRFAPRNYDLVYELPENVQSVHNEVHRLFFIICLRMATYKESKEHFFTPEEFGKIIYENFLFDIPKLMDLSVLYGAENGPLLTKMIGNIFSQQRAYEQDLKAVVPTILEVLQNIAVKCGIHVESTPNTPLKLEAGGKKNSLVTMTTAGFQDIIFYLSDTANTLWAFLDVYPEASKAFNEDEFTARVAALYEAMVPVLENAFTERQWETDSHRNLLRYKLRSSQVALLRITRQVIFQTSLLPLLDNGSPEEAERCVEGYLHMMTGLLAERRFLAHLEHLYPFRDDRDILSQSPYPVDETRLQFIQQAVSEAYAIYGKKSSSSPEPAAAATCELTPEPTPEGATAGPEYEAVDEDELGACAPRIRGVELDSLISSVKDLLPDLGEGYIELCLEEMNYEMEKVINMVLEDKLPPSLQGQDKTMPRLRRKPAPSETSLLAERKNVFDEDEFDVFSRDKIDTQKIHQGKKDKIGDGGSFLDDKSTIAGLRPLYDKYGGEFAESLYEQEGGEYDDEYDDTYDDNLVGAQDEDSADELTTRRPFTTPRVLMGNGPQGPRSRSWDNQSDEEEDERNKDNFLMDPAKLREQQEARRASKQARQHKKPQGGGQGQTEGQGHRKHDVKGAPKGQGQSDDVVKNRAWKEKNKSTRVHHNRKNLADKKRKF